MPDFFCGYLGETLTFLLWKTPWFENFQAEENDPKTWEIP